MQGATKIRSDSKRALLAGDWWWAAVQAGFLFLAAMALSGAQSGLIDQIPRAEYDALVALYNATEGDSWPNQTGWRDESARDWSGVSVTGVEFGTNTAGELIVTNPGNVAALLLQGNRLKGPLPESIGLFPELVGLDLRSNQLTGALPASLGNLMKLGSLRLSGNQFSGDLPETFQGLPQLEILHLNGNQLTGSLPSWLGDLTHLRELDLSTNQFSGEIPNNLNLLQKLTALGLARNDLSGSIPSTLSGFPFLLTLTLSDNELTGAIPLDLGQLTNTPWTGVWVDLRENCLDLGNAAAVQAALPATARFDYTPQSDCTPSDPPDLRSTLFEVVEESVDWVNPIKVRFKVENLGPGISEAFRVSFILSADPFKIDSGSVLLKTVLLPGLAPLESTSILTETIELPQTVSNAGPTGAPNQFYIGIVVDPFEQIAEADELNNYIPTLGVGYDAIRILGPAIIVSEQFDAHHLDHAGEGFDPGDEMRVDYHLVNVGYGDSEAFFLEFLWDPPLGSKLSDGYLGRVEIAEGLESGSETFGYFIATLPLDGSDAYEPLGTGTYQVKPALDPFPLEAFAFRNPYYTGDEIYGDEVLMIGLCADLKVGEFTIDAFYPDFRPGDNVPLVFSFLNDSPVEVTEDFTVAIVLSKDAVIDPDTDLILKQIPVDGADRHTTRRFLFESVDLPPQGDPFWLPGNQTYYLGLVIDLNEDVNDCSRADNITTAGIAKALKVDPIPHSIGGSGASGNGSSSAPYTSPSNQRTGPIEADSRARFHFEAGALKPLRLFEFQLERATGSGTLYFTLDGSPPSPGNFAYRLDIEAEDPGPFVVPIISRSGQFRVFADLPGGITEGFFEVVQMLPPLPAVSVLTPEDPSTSSWQFGMDVAIDENTIVVADQSDDIASGTANYGAVHIFRWNGRVWEQHKLAQESGFVQQFGWSLAVHRDSVAVGFGSFSGNIWAYQWDGTEWVETILTPTVGEVRNWGFGSSLAIADDVLAVGADSYNKSGNTDVPGAGGVYLFHREDDEWVETVLTPSDGQIDDQFGYDLSLSGESVAVSSVGWGGYTDTGSVYVFRWDGEAWEETILREEGPLEPHYTGTGFGGSVSLDGDRLAVGAIGSGARKGSVHLYEWNGGDWSGSTILQPSDSAAGDRFGGKVTLVGDQLTVASKASVYQFEWDGESWKETKWREGPPEGTTNHLWAPALSSNGSALALGEAIFPGPSVCTVYNLQAETGPFPADPLLEKYFSAEAIADNRYALLADDPDGDGQNTISELLVGTHPLERTSSLSPLSVSPDGGQLEVTLSRHIDAADLDVILMVSENLSDWVPADPQPAFLASDPLDGLEAWQSSISVDAESESESTFTRLLIRE